MLIYPTDQVEPLQFPFPQDPSEKLDYTFKWGNYSWETSKVYKLNDRIVPTVDNGTVLICINPGKSGSTEPTWSTLKNTHITDGTVIWRVIWEPVLLTYGEYISTSTWAASNVNITVSDASFTNTTSTVFISTIPATITSFTLTNTITTSAIISRTYERSIIVPVKQL